MFITNLIDKYAKKPERYHNLTLADFASKYNARWNKGGLDITRRETPKIIRFRNYNQHTETEDYYRELLLLHHPWHGDEASLKQQCGTYHQAYTLVDDTIQANWAQYNILKVERINAAFQTADKKLQRNDNDHVKHVLSNMATCDEQHFQQKPKIARKKVFSGIQKDTALLDKQQYSSLVSTLSREQRRFYEHVKWCVVDNRQVLNFLSGGAGVGKSGVAKALTQWLICHFRSELCATRIRGPRPSLPTRSAPRGPKMRLSFPTPVGTTRGSWRHSWTIRHWSDVHEPWPQGKLPARTGCLTKCSNTGQHPCYDASTPCCADS